MPAVARSRVRRWRYFFILSGLSGILLAAIAAIWVVHLDRVVTREFQGRLWSVPARVYAAPLELYAGAPISANDLEQQLQALHYRRADAASGPGTYRRTGNAFDLQARRVRFIDEHTVVAAIDLRERVAQRFQKVLVRCDDRAVHLEFDHGLGLVDRNSLRQRIARGRIGSPKGHATPIFSLTGTSVA